MKNTDLRIGNWVSLKGCHKQVVWVKYSKICVMNGYPSSIVDLEDIEPIPLTEEILLKCGFKCNKHGGIFAITEFPSVICIYKDGDTKWNDRYIDCKILYLHQLQNLYQALTGQELKIEL